MSKERDEYYFGSIVVQNLRGSLLNSIIGKVKSSNNHPQVRSSNTFKMSHHGDVGTSNKQLSRTMKPQNLYRDNTTSAYRDVYKA